MQVRSFNNAYELTDYTEELLLIPNTYGTISQMGLFSEEGVAQNTITVESTTGTLGVVPDKVRGERNSVNKDEVRNLRAFPLGHYPLDDYVTPSDVQGKRAYGTADAAETEAAVIARKMERIRRNHAVTLEVARAYAITEGAIWAPNGTIAGNYYTDFGITRKEINFALATPTTDVLAKSEEAIAHIQDEIQSGEVVTGVTALCSPQFFAALITQAKVAEAYRYYSSTQEPLRNRLGTGIQRKFVHGGVEYIELRDNFNGVPIIPTGTAFFVPMGTSDVFKTYFGPAHTFEHVNTIGEAAYMFSYRDPSNQKITLQTESNFLNLIRRPQAIVKATAA